MTTTKALATFTNCHFASLASVTIKLDSGDELAVDKQLVAKRCPFFRDNYASQLREDVDSPIHLTRESLGTLNVFAKWLYADLVPHKTRYPGDSNRAAEAALNIVDFYLLAERYRLPDDAKILALDELLDLYRRTSFRVFGLLPHVMKNTAGLAESPLRKLMIDIACDGFSKGSYNYEQVMTGCSLRERAEFDQAVVHFSNERSQMDQIFEAKQFKGPNLPSPLPVKAIPRYQVGFLNKESISTSTALERLQNSASSYAPHRKVSAGNLNPLAGDFNPGAPVGSPFETLSINVPEKRVELDTRPGFSWTGHSQANPNIYLFEGIVPGPLGVTPSSANLEKEDHQSQGGNANNAIGANISNEESNIARKTNDESPSGQLQILGRSKTTASIGELTGVKCFLCGAENGHRVLEGF
ncbi:MAG: hypothetical protein Q9227_004912 [Pyrenula ochraceoflavens]